MKKMTEKKLVLSKETVRSLEEVAQQKVQGAACYTNSETYRYCPRELTD